MWNFQRIICIWICCVSCMFGTTQLSTLVQAVPYEYFDDHDQSFYDLDTEQIQAKYDTRLLSQQMLNTEQQPQYLEKDKKDFKLSNTGPGVDTQEHPLNILTKLKTNNGHINIMGDDVATTVTAASTAITEQVEELYLPRAASCYTNGQKYTHGQKVPRLDSCEVCLCMDGEIFCWWEKCDKKPATQPATYDDYSTPYEESSTTRIHASNIKSTYKTTLKPKAKGKVAVAVADYKYNDEDSTELRSDMQQEYEEGSKEKQMMKKQQQYKIHNKQMVKKKIYQQQEEKKHNMKIKEQQAEKKHEQEEPYKRQHKANEHAAATQAQQQHHHMHSHHEYGSTSGTNKILNFPENLPSVLYYDYKTEEHHQHQHQHHEQHLKHQRQQQHEKELKHRQQQQQEQKKKERLQQQQKQKNQQKHHHVNRHHEYGQDFNTYTDEMRASTPTWLRMMEGDGHGGSSTFKYYSNGNDNIHNVVDLQTDSDILPEPPTKKPKLTATSVTTTTSAAAAESPAYHVSTSTLTTSSTATITAGPLKKQLFSPWDYGKPNRNKVNKNNNESTEDSDNQDDAFHRWLTSTETNNKTNFTVNGNEGIVSSDANGKVVLAVAVAGSSDYNIDDKNYENIDIDIETGNGAQPPTAMQLTTTTTPTTNVNAIQEINANITTTAGRVGPEVGYGEDIKTNRNFANSRTSKYEQHYVDNKDKNNNILEENLNIENSNNNISPFSNPYQNYNDNNRQIINPSSRSSISSSSSSRNSESASSSASNEDNGVANVVNIDILLTASSADLQQQQQQQQLEQQQQQDLLLNDAEKTTRPQEQLLEFEHEKQISSKQVKFVPAPVLISNTNDVLDNNKLLSSITTNDNNDNITKTRTTTSTTNNIVGGPNAKPPKTMGVNLLSNSNNSNSSSSTTITSNLNNNYNYNNNSATGGSSSRGSSSQSISDSSYKFNNLSTVLQSTATNFVDVADGDGVVDAPITTATPALNATTLSPERLCNVMGTLYRIGDVLPQDTGNCLQCICIDGSTSDDTPRVTCSPHNCPPLVLPDLFDATGY